VQLLSPSEQDEGADLASPHLGEDGAADEARAAVTDEVEPPAVGRQLSRVAPKGEKELDELIKAATSEEAVSATARTARPHGRSDSTDAQASPQTHSAAPCRSLTPLSSLDTWQVLEQQLKETLQSQLSASQSAVDAMLTGSDFAWMRVVKHKQKANPYRTRTCCYFDFTRGEAGSRDGAPFAMSPVGTWLAVRTADTRVQSRRFL
jgi:hypothetical protein